MKLDTVGPIIATRTLTLAKKGSVKVTIGKPEKFPDGGDYYCPYQITGIGSGKIKYAGGVDSVQALFLALQNIGTDLYTSDEAKSGSLKWLDTEPHADLGFPVPDILRNVARPPTGKRSSK